MSIDAVVVLAMTHFLCRKRSGGFHKRQTKKTMLTVLAVVALALVAASSGAHTILPQPTSVTEGGGVVAVDAAQFKVCVRMCVYICVGVGCWGWR